MTNFICNVSNRFPENYEIGLRALTRGVEEGYKHKINRSRPGDLLFFVVGGYVKSIHEIESNVYFDNTQLWPPKDNSNFPHRIKISKPFKSGNVSLREVYENISFMKGKRWGGTIQGPNGVFNDRLTPSDVEFLKQRMDTPNTLQPRHIPKEYKEVKERQEAFFKFFEKDIEDRIDPLLQALGLSLFIDHKSGKTGRQFVCDAGRIDLLCEDQNSGQFVIVELKKGKAPNETLLQILKYMSWVRQHMSNGKEVKGIILTESADSSLKGILGEVPNVSIEYYKVTLELVDSDHYLDVNSVQE